MPSYEDSFSLKGALESYRKVEFVFTASMNRVDGNPTIMHASTMYCRGYSQWEYLYKSDYIPRC